MRTTSKAKRGRSTRSTPKKRSRAAAPTRTTHRKKTRRAPVRNTVEVDEARERVGEREPALGPATVAGVGELGEELGEAFVENVTGADDAATEQRGLGDDAPAFLTGSASYAD